MATFNETASGGIVAGGSGAYGPNDLDVTMVAAQVVGNPQYSNIGNVVAQAVGNTKVGSVSSLGIEVLAGADYVEATGAALLAGESLPTGSQTAIAEGGAEVGGEVVPGATSERVEGGAEVGGAGEFDYSANPLLTAEGVDVGGHAAMFFEDIAEGGAVLAGLGLAENFTPGQGGAEVGGESIFDYTANVELNGEAALLSGVGDYITRIAVEDTFTISAGSDDGYWTGTTGTFNAVDPVVFVGHETTFGSIRTFWRFDNVPIPPGSTIFGATMNVKTGGSAGGTPAVRLHMNDADNAIAPVSKLDADNKALTSASTINWNPTGTLVANTDVTSPDLSGPIQEVVNRPGWSGGNALMVLAVPVTAFGDNFQSFSSQEGAYQSAELTVSYSTGTIYFEGVFGSVEIGGAAEELFFQNIGLGAALLAGEAELSPIGRYFATGGAEVGGEIEQLNILNPIIEGGAVLGGDAQPFTVVGDFVASGGAELGGESLVQSGIIAAGGADVGGDAVTNFYDIIEETLDGEGVDVGGTSILNIAKFFMTSGGFETGGQGDVNTNYTFESSGNSDNKPPENAGVSIGYNNDTNPTIVDLEFSFDTEISWSTDKAVELDTQIVWDTGTLPLFFYRIVGKAKFLDECDPLQGVGECCKQFIINVSARSITDLCERLQKRRWKWPIQLVQRFSRPAETVLVESDDGCNVLEEVQICDNVVCEDFCIDYDVRETWGTLEKVQVDAFKTYVGDGVINIAGTADTPLDANFEYVYEMTGEIEVGGVARTLSNFVDAIGGVSVASGICAATQSSSWYYVGGEWPLETGPQPKTTDQFIEGLGDRVWNDPQNVVFSDDSPAFADTTNGIPSRFLVVKDFNFNVPAGSRIVGIEVQIERHATGSVQDDQVYLVVDEEIVSDNMAASGTWPIGIDATKTYGGVGDVWRDPDDIDYLGEWDLTDINNAEFGVAIRVAPTVAQLTSESRIDSVRLIVYYEDPNQHLMVTGEARTIADSYIYESDGGMLLIGGEVDPPKLHFPYLGEGEIFSGGSYGNSIIAEGLSGGVETSGGAQIGQPGVKSGGSAKIETTRNFHTMSGGLTLETFSGLYNWNAKYNPTGGFNIDGLAGFNNKFDYIPTGEITIGGDAVWRSTAFKWVSDGNAIFIFGEADNNFSDFGTLETNIGAVVEAKEVAIRFREETTEFDETPNDLVTECSCSEMDLIMPMRHNLDTNNKLAQFLQRNNLAISDTLGLKYSRVNDSWIFNQVFEGFGTEGLDREMWNLIFQLQCTNNVAGDTLDTRIWRFSMQIIQKNLRTFADYDTRLIVGFLPDAVCDDAGFGVKIEIDTQTDFTLLTPETTLYEFKLHDNISLFKNQFWIDNPNLVIQLSQTGLETFPERYALNIT